MGHTPGPWAYALDESEWRSKTDPPVYQIFGTYERREGDCLVAELNGYGPKPGTIEQGCGGDPEANARLIAAAPDLLAALIDILPYAERSIKNLTDQMAGSLYPSINAAKLERARAAIAKATP